MICDTLEHLARYNGLHPNLDTAIDYLLTHDLSALPNGRTEVDCDEVFINVMDAALHPDAGYHPEYHKLYADLQIDITGGDMMITIIVLVWASAIISSFLDNIPLVDTLIPIITTMEATGMDVMPLWWAVALGACIGGIGTLIGASANVVLAGISGKYGHPITFMDYTKVGFLMMLVFTAISCVYLVLRFCVFV